MMMKKRTFTKEEKQLDGFEVEKNKEMIGAENISTTIGTIIAIGCSLMLQILKKKCMFVESSTNLN